MYKNKRPIMSVHTARLGKTINKFILENVLENIHLEKREGEGRITLKLISWKYYVRNESG
jgi:hypothetical protein